MWKREVWGKNGPTHCAPQVILNIWIIFKGFPSLHFCTDRHELQRCVSICQVAAAVCQVETHWSRRKWQHKLSSSQAGTDARRQERKTLCFRIGVHQTCAVAVFLSRCKCWNWTPTPCSSISDFWSAYVWPTDCPADDNRNPYCYSTFRNRVTKCFSSYKVGWLCILQNKNSKKEKKKSDWAGFPSPCFSTLEHHIGKRWWKCQN